MPELALCKCLIAKEEWEQVGVVDTFFHAQGHGIAAALFEVVGGGLGMVGEGHVVDDVGAVVFVGVEGFFDGDIKDAGFEAGEAFETPVAEGHVQDPLFLAGAFGLDGGFEAIVVFGEVVGAFHVFDCKGVGQEAEFQGVLGGFLFAFGGLRPGGSESVGAVGSELRLGDGDAGWFAHGLEVARGWLGLVGEFWLCC